MRKPRTFSYYIFKTDCGWMGVVRTILGIYAVVLPKTSKQDVSDELNQRFKKGLKEGLRGFKNVVKQLQAYLLGKKIRFNNCLDLSGVSKFDKKVWRIACKIPRGENRSYGWIAQKLKASSRAAQAVGQALARNRLPIIIPCHRVMEKGGSLGGFTPGVALKRLLLKIEGRLW